MKYFIKNLRSIADLYEQKSSWLKLQAVHEVIRHIASELEKRNTPISANAERTWYAGKGSCPLGACKIYWKSDKLPSQAVIYSDADGWLKVAFADRTSDADRLSSELANIDHIEYYEESL